VPNGLPSGCTWARRAVGEGVKSRPRADADDLHVRFDERDVETEPWLEPLRHGQTKEAATDMLSLQPPRRLYQKRHSRTSACGGRKADIRRSGEVRKVPKIRSRQ
jgi:hypothetical protein